jgi:large subunit ribosomal protein L10
MLRTEKSQAIEYIRGKFQKMSSAVFVDYAGLTVEQVSKLRDNLREKGVEYKVLKNKLIKFALKDHAFVDSLGKEALRGMTAVAFSFEEPSAAARVLKEYRKENEKLKIKGGLLEGQVLDSKAVEDQLATLPNKDEARSMLLATMIAPAQTFLRLLNVPARDFVGVMAAKQRKDEGK